MAILSQAEMRLPDIAHLASYDQESDVPAVGAFIQDPDGKGLSVNRLQYYQDENRTGAVDRIRAEVRGYYDVRKRGRFVVFNVARAKGAAREKRVRY